MPRQLHAFALAIAITLSTLAAAALSARAADAPPWNLLLGDAITDTLDVPLAQALDAGRWVLLHDRWDLVPSDPVSGKLVSLWKPVHHPLVRLVTGEARVRVAVAMHALGAARTEVVVQGGIATETNLEGSPVLGLARTAGNHELHGYCDEVRARLADQRVARADAPGGKSGPAPSSLGH